MSPTRPSGDNGDGDGIAPDDAFLLLSHEIRVEILLALWQASDHALSFSDLRDRVAVRDSAKFSYHLSELTGRFVAHDEEAALYRLRYPGHRVVDAVQSGVYHDAVDGERFALSSACTRCGESLSLSYEEYVATVACPECGRTLLRSVFDPGGIRDRSGDAAATALDKRLRHDWTLCRDGVCPSCNGTVTGHLQKTDGLTGLVPVDHDVVAAFDCEQCSFYNYAPVGALLLDHPALVSALRGADTDLRDVPLWRLPFVVENAALTVSEPEGLSVTVAVESEGATLSYCVDRSLSVSVAD